MDEITATQIGKQIFDEEQDKLGRKLKNLENRTNRIWRIRNSLYKLNLSFDSSELEKAIFKELGKLSNEIQKIEDALGID